jgi:hypothetical protein
MARLGFAIHEFRSAGTVVADELLDSKAKPWDDGE